jgi:hypothetical protein
MRILVTGSRDWADEQAVRNALLAATAGMPGESVTVVHGDCPTGADAFADKAARDYGMVPEPHPALWKEFGRRAGPKRNAEMAELGADLCLAFVGNCSSETCRDPKPHGSHGTVNCTVLVKAAGIPIRRYYDRERRLTQDWQTEGQEGQEGVDGD